MPRDIFDDLTDWGRVLAELASLRDKGLLDEHQAGLARLIRYRDNWRLREEALKCAAHITQANDLLIADSLNVLVDQDLALSTRILAARALGHLLPRRPAQGSSKLDPATVIKTMSDLVARRCSPALDEEIRAAIAAAKAAVGATHE